MTAATQPGFGTRFLLIVIAVLACTSVVAAETPSAHPLEPPDRSSPRATLTTFLDSIDTAWTLYTAKDPSVRDVFARARGCLDLSDVPPLVVHEISAQSALVLKEVLDRIELPPMTDIPDAAEVATLGLKRWTIPHTEITLFQEDDGDRAGEWLFSRETVARATEFYEKVRSLPYRPGRLGGHIEALRAGTDATLVGKLVSALPPSVRAEVNGMLVWQWVALGLLVLVLALAATAAAWLGRRWRASRMPGARLGVYLFPLMLIATPFFGRFMILRLFKLPGEPVLWLRLVFSMAGHVGLAWLGAVILTRIGAFIADHGFRDARPLKKQLIRVMFRIASIVAITVIGVMALQRLGVPVAGLVAGVGVGGLAIALAAQSTLENFIGGIILYADQPVKVGDFCKFGERRGVVEDVGLRSVKIRTLDRTIVTVPNADFAKLQLENLAERDRVLLRENLRLRYETTRAQLEAVMSEFEAMLKAHDRIAEEPLRVRFIGFGEYYLEVELYAYAMTDAWPEFLEIREDVLMKVMDIIELSGTRLALPTGVRYLSGQGTSDKPSATKPSAT
jgi:MscS family membrane protein